MAVKGHLIWICCLAVLSSSTAEHETQQNCSSQSQLFESLSASLKAAEQYGVNLPSALSSQQSASLLLSMRNLANYLHKHQLKECENVESRKCPQAEVPKNGGLVCVTVVNNTYCKPMCNHGYDFGFLRMSRLFDVCGEQTGYKWDTQYIGGNTLAVCNKAPFQISGAKSAYFPEGQDCLTTKSNSQLHDTTIKTFTSELPSKGTEEAPTCLVCG